MDTTTLLWLALGLTDLVAGGRSPRAQRRALLAAYVLWTYRTEQAGTAPQARTDLRAA